MICLICLDENEITELNELVHIIECKNCQEKNVMVHRKCMDDWKKASFKEKDGNVTCPHCSCKMYLHIQPININLILFYFMICLTHLNFCKFYCFSFPENTKEKKVLKLE